MTEQTKPATPVRAHSSPTPLDLAARAAHRDSPGTAEPDTAAVPEEQPAGRAGDSSPADPAAVVSGAAAAAGGGLPGPGGHTGSGHTGSGHTGSGHTGSGHRGRPHRAARAGTLVRSPGRPHGPG